MRMNINIDTVIGPCFFGEEFSEVRPNVNIVNIGHGWFKQ